MIIVVYRKSDGRVKGVVTLPETYDTSRYEDEKHSVLQVNDQPNLNSKVVDGQVVPIKEGDYPEEELEEAWFKVRQKRYALLSASDWTQTNDSPKKSNPSWVKYRKDLRDITDQPGAPHNVVWPTKPDS